MLSKSCLVALCATTLFGASAMAQAPPPSGPRPWMGPAGLDVQQLPEIRGIVQRFTLTPRGDLDGFLLSDNTDVHFPPHLSAELAATVRPGDPVAVRGYRSSTVPLVVAAAVTNASTNRTVMDQGPPGPGFGPRPPPPGYPAPGAQQSSLTGKVLASLYGPAGDLNGAVLEDGTIVRMPPHVAYQVASALIPGQVVTVEGWLLITDYGRVVEAQIVSSSAAPASAGAPLPPPRP
jgi:hypothetical protein